MDTLRTSGTSNEAVERGTGRNWQEWFLILDGHRASDLPHKNIALILSEKYKLSPWWSQQVTVGYERERGLRVKNQRTGGFEISASKTLPIPLSLLFSYCRDIRLRKRWLVESKLALTKIVPGKRILARWNGSRTSLRFEFCAKGPEKSQVVIQHGKLPDEESANEMRIYWKSRLAELEEAISR